MTNTDAHTGYDDGRPPPTPRPIAVSPDEACRLVGVGRTFLYEAIGSGALRSVKLGRRRLVMLEDLYAWLDDHEAAPAAREEARA